MKREKRCRKRSKKVFRYAIGFDECLNGFETPYAHHPFMVMVGYLGADGREYGTAPYGSKRNRNFLGKTKSQLEEVLSCARPFLEANPSYKYVIIPEKKIESPMDLYIKKAEAIAIMTQKFFKEKKDLNQDNTALFIDETDGKINSQFLNTALQYLLEDQGLKKLHHESKRCGEKSKQVISRADRIAYYLASIKLISKSRAWPHRTKRLHLFN